MIKNFKNFIKVAKDIKLSENEKDSLRYKLSEFLLMSPIRGGIPEIGKVRYLSVFTVRHFIKATSLVLIFAIVIGGTGVSYAASNALPGDALYSIKVNVNEGIEDALATTPKGKVAVESKKVERRLEEAQILVKEKKLTPATKKIVEAKLDEHLQNISKQIEEMKKDGDVELALETTSSLTPVLETHRQILEDASEKEDSKATDQTSQNTDALIAKVDDSIEKVQNEETSIIASLPDNEGDGVQAKTAATLMTTAVTEDPGQDSSSVSDNSDVTVKTDEGLSDEEIAQRALEKQNDLAEQQLKKLKNNLSDIVEARIKSAQEKIVTIKKEIAADALNEKKIETSSLTPTAPLTEENKSLTTDTTVAQQEKTETVQDSTVFDPNQKVQEADKLIGEAKNLFSQGQFKEALEIAQNVNRIATEIETHRKLKALEIAQETVPTETLKASASTSILK